MSPSTDSSVIWPVLCEFSHLEPVPFDVAGHCMAPVINHGDRIAVRAARRYVPGDIILVRRRRSRPVVHRMIGCVPTARGWRFFTRGDHEPLVDGGVARTEILGRVEQCRGRAVAVLPADRLRALGRFVGFLVRRLVHPHGLR